MWKVCSWVWEEFELFIIVIMKNSLYCYYVSSFGLQ